MAIQLKAVEVAKAKEAELATMKAEYEVRATEEAAEAAGLPSDHYWQVIHAGSAKCSASGKGPKSGTAKAAEAAKKRQAAVQVANKGSRRGIAKCS